MHFRLATTNKLTQSQRLRALADRLERLMVEAEQDKLTRLGVIADLRAEADRLDHAG